MLTLPAPDHTQLPNAKLPLVVTQVRFDRRRDEITPDELASVQAALTHAALANLRLDRLTSQQLISLPVGIQPVAAVSGWRMAAPSGSWQVNLFPDSISVETPAFSGFDAMRSVIADALAAVHAVLAPAVAGRVGLRFVNVLPHPGPGDDARTWVDWMSPALTGPIADHVLAPGVVGLEQRMVLRVSDDVTAAVHSGVVGEGEGQQFLLDIDCSTDYAALWDTSRLVETISSLNDFSVSLFYVLCGDRMLAHLRGNGGTA